MVASRYAKALFQAGEDLDCLDVLYNEFNKVVDFLFSNVELYDVLKSPLVGKDDKKNILDKVLNKEVSLYIINFFKIIIDKERILFLPKIKEELKQLFNEKNNIVEATATTAIKMTDEEVKSLEYKLSKKYNKKVILTNIVDSSIIGGVLVRVGNEEIDGTVKSNLAKLKENLSMVIS